MLFSANQTHRLAGETSRALNDLMRKEPSSEDAQAVAQARDDSFPAGWPSALKRKVPTNGESIFCKCKTIKSNRQ
jgi:hypothetical protein